MLRFEKPNAIFAFGLGAIATTLRIWGIIMLAQAHASMKPHRILT
jgi:hypothetical protein